MKDKVVENKVKETDLFIFESFPGFFLSARTPKVIMEVAFNINEIDNPIEARIESKLIVYT